MVSSVDVLEFLFLDSFLYQAVAIHSYSLLKNTRISAVVVSDTPLLIEEVLHSGGIE